MSVAEVAPGSICQMESAPERWSQITDPSHRRGDYQR